MFGRISTRLTIFGICLAAGCGDAGGRPNLADDAESTLNYAAWAYDGEGMAKIDDDLPGLILMRDESDMTALGGSHFDDGLENLVVRGTFVAAAAGTSDYALTFLKKGGVQLALDFRQDRVVDAVFDITREGHFGVIGDLALESEIDCIARRMIAGEDPLSAVHACLGPSRNMDGMAAGSGIAGPTGGEYDDLAEPDCGSAGSPGRPLDLVSESPGNEWKHHGPWGPERTGEYMASGTSYSRPSGIPGVAADSIDVAQLEHIETGDTIMVETETNHHEHGPPTVTETRSQTTHLPNGQTRESRSTYVNGVKVSSRTSYYDTATGECLGGACKDDEAEGADATDAATTDSESTSSGSNTGSDAIGQPGPNCELEGDCPFTDPRCAGPNNDMEALWDCVARTGSSPMDCLAQLNDAVYATTGCMTVLGPSGQPELQCPGSDADDLTDCLASDGALDGCLGQGGGGVNENDDLLDTFSGVGASDLAYLDFSGIGAIFLGFCDEGVEQLCGGRPLY